MSNAINFNNSTMSQRGFLVAVCIVGLALGASVMPVEAGLPSGCLLDETGVAGCTAGDVGVNDILVTVVSDGCISLTDTATVNIELQINAAQPTRYDIGLFLATDGGDAVSTGGTCFHEALFPLKTPSGTLPTPADRASGIGPFLDSDGDSCGEVTSLNSYQRVLVAGDIASGSTTPAELVISCADTIDEFGAAIPNGYVDLGWVVSWYQNASNICTSVAQAVPGTSSKCQTGRTDSKNSVGIPISVPTAGLGIDINCTPDIVGPGDTISCTVTYTNPGLGAADNIEYRIDFPDDGTVSNVSTVAADYVDQSVTGDPGNGVTSEYIQLVPNADATTPEIPVAANVPGGTSTLMTFDFTVSDTASDGPFDMTVYTWFNNGTFTSYQSLFDTDTTQVTPAVVSDFTTHRHRGQTLVQWETAAETATAGFYLDRKNPATGEWTRVNDGLLPAMLEHPGGGTYAFLDIQASPLNTEIYRLIAVDVNGGQEIHGPYERSPSGESRFEDFDATQFKGFARLAHRPSTAAVAAWDAKREARHEEMQLFALNKGLGETGSAPKSAKIKTSNEGLVSISTATLSDLFDMTDNDLRRALRKGQLVLSHQNRTVAYLPSSDLDRLFFFAQDVDSRFTNENTYWATFEKRSDVGGTVTQMNEVGGGVPSTVVAPQTFLSRSTVDEDVWLVTYAVQDPEADVWFGGFVSTGYFGDTTYVTNVSAPDAAEAGQAEISLSLLGLSNLAVGDDHHAELRLNGALIGETRWDGATPTTLIAKFDQSILNRYGDNTIEVNGVLHDGVEQSSFVVDSLELVYNRYFRALNNSLRFASDGHRAITVDGFDGPEIEVFDIGMPSQPLHINATRIENSPSGYQVTFAPTSSNGTYLAVLRSAAAAPLSIEIDQPSSLKSRINSSEYVVIAPASLSRGARDLVDLRSERFPDAKLVNLQDVYDEFNGGIEDPSAIRSFIRYALSNWNTAPRFVTLVGKGTLDPKDFQGYGTNVLPVLLSSTPYGVFASDSRIADVVGADGVPDVAIGRIPALSSADLQAYVEKLRRYEDTNLRGAQNALMLADNADGAGDFPVDSQSVARFLPSDVKPIQIAYETGTDASFTRQQVLTSLENGVALFNYIGHGGPTLLGSEAFWTMEDVAAMNNSNNKLPIFAAFTCYAGNGTYPGLNSLTEEMVLLERGGVVAALAPTGLSINNRAVVLNKNFISAFLERDLTIGEATQSAIKELQLQGGPQFMQEIYNVVGDPAVQVNH